MKKIIFPMGFLSLFTQFNAQTGVNTTNPQATLDVTLPSNYSNGQSAGISFPTLTGNQIEAMVTTNLKPGTLIYASSISTATTPDVNRVGFWYWTGDAAKKWEPFLDNAIIPTEPWNVAGAATPTPATSNIQSIYQMGNIGIATPNPVTRLHITSDVGADHMLRLQKAGDNKITDLVKRDNGTFNIYNHDGTTFTPGISLDKTGKVGMGTEAPSYKLDVNGEVINNGWYRSRGSTGWYSETYGGGIYMTDSNWIRTYSSKSFWTDSLLGSTGGLTIGYNGNTPNTTAGAIIAGNVGIGTATPSNKLHIVSTTDPVKIEGLQTSSSSNDKVVVSDENGVLKTKNASSIGTGNFWGLTGNSGTSPSTNYIGTNDDLAFVVKTNGMRNATFWSSGNLSISSDPTDYYAYTKLDVNGVTKSKQFYSFSTEANTQRHSAILNISSLGGNYSTPAFLQKDNVLGGFINRDAKSFFDAAGTQNYGGSEIYAFATENFTPLNKGSNLVFRTTPNGGTSSIERMRIENNGNVGIGTGTPTSKLHLYNNNLNFSAIESISDNSDGGLIDDYTFKSYSNTANGPVMTFWMLAQRGTFSNPQPLVTGDRIFNIAGKAHGILSSDYIVNYKGNGSNALSETRFVNSGSPALIINPSNNIGIGTDVINNKLEVGGSVGANAFNNTSDQRFKENIAPINHGLSTINQLKPVQYTWNTKGKEKGGDDKEHIGFIAQEIEKIVPSIVNTAPDSYKTVNYIELIPILTKAIQEQQKEMEAKDKRIDNLEKRLETIEKLLKK